MTPNHINKKRKLQNGNAPTWGYGEVLDFDFELESLDLGPFLLSGIVGVELLV